MVKWASRIRTNSAVHVHMNRRVAFLGALMVLFSPSLPARKPPMSACEALLACRRYDGKTITITGKYFANDHGRWLMGVDCVDRPASEAFAVVDWQLHTKSEGEPSMDNLIRSRSPSGRPTWMEGPITAVVKVQCLDSLRSKPGFDVEMEPGLFQDGRFACGILSILRIVSTTNGPH